MIDKLIEWFIKYKIASVAVHGALVAVLGIGLVAYGIKQLIETLQERKKMK